MPQHILGLEPGSLSECVAAIAAVAGSVLSVFALKFGLAANRTADQTRREAKEASDASAERERVRDAADLERERRLIAGSVAAWWAADRAEDDRRYGVVVSNQSTTASVFYDVDVRVTGRVGGPHVIHMNVLPPGRFFVPQVFSGSRVNWERIPLPVLASDVLDPFTVAQDRRIDSIEYTDGLGTRWRWSPKDGLTDARSATGHRARPPRAEGPTSNEKNRARAVRRVEAVRLRDARRDGPVISQHRSELPARAVDR